MARQARGSFLAPSPAAPTTRSRFSQTSRVVVGELPLEGSNLDYLIQSAGSRATKTDKLTGNGVPTSIGALSV